MVGRYPVKLQIVFYATALKGGVESIFARLADPSQGGRSMLYFYSKVANFIETWSGKLSFRPWTGPLLGSANIKQIFCVLSKSSESTSKIFSKTLLLGILFYRAILRVLLGGDCRFYPTCSEYAAEAVQTHSALKATYLIGRRIIRCRPFGPQGYDPVPCASRHQKAASQAISNHTLSECHRAFSINFKSVIESHFKITPSNLRGSK